MSLNLCFFFSQDRQLRELVAIMGVSGILSPNVTAQPRNWKKIANLLGDRTDVQCLHRWNKVLNPEMIKGPWTDEEDRILVASVEKYGAQNWSTIAQFLEGRIGKQCRER